MIEQSENSCQVLSSFQPNLPLPAEPFLYLNPGSNGFFTILRKHKERSGEVLSGDLFVPWGRSETEPILREVVRSTTHKMSSLPDVLRYIDRTRDTWISQNQFFRRNRRLVNLWQLNTCFADLDTYKNEYLRRLTPEGLAMLCLEECAEKAIPSPSVILFSGRGLQAKWILTKPLPRPALPRWNALQRYLTAALAGMGADQNSIDGSRVLRLEKTVNTKTDPPEMVRVLWPERSSPVTYDFDLLADEVLPFTREQIQDIRRTREGRKAQIQHIKRNLLFTGQSLSWARLEDIRKLAHLRGWTQGNPDGMRDPFIFTGTVFASWLSRGNPLFWEAESLTKEFAPHWSRRKIMGTVGSYFQMVEAGRRYRFTNERLLQVLQITGEEERQLKTILSIDEARRRHREREEAKRRAAGAVEREKYEAGAAERRLKALEMRQKGLTYGEIATKLGVTRRHIIRILKGG